MSQIFSADAIRPSLPIAVVTTAETIAATGNELPIPYVNGKVIIRGFILFTVGTDATSVTVRVRRGTSITSTLVSGAVAVTQGVAAAAVVAIPFYAVDIVGALGTVQYSVTVQQAAATANGSIVDAVINTEVISG